MFRLIVLLMVALMLASPAFAQPVKEDGDHGLANHLTPQEIGEKALDATVLLVVTDAKDQPIGVGSGFFVRPNLIATNKHVISKAAGGVVKRVRDDTKFDIEGVMATDEKHDLAILRVSGSSVSTLPLGDSDSVSIGDVVYVVGNPEGFEGTFSDGVISGVRGSNSDNGKRLQMTAPISPGSSGGPVLNTRGEVIGVAVSSVIGGQNINFAVPSNYLGLLIGSARKRTPKPLSEGKKSISAEAEFYFLSGMTRYQQLGQHDAAIADFDAAIRVKPDYADAYFGRGAAKADLGRYDAAIADYDVAIRLKPNYADAYIGRGAAKGRSGQHFAAMSDYDVAITAEA